MIPTSMRPTGAGAIGTAPVWKDGVWITGTVQIGIDGLITIYGGGLDAKFGTAVGVQGVSAFSLTWQL